MKEQKKHVVKMINNISTQNLYIKTIMYYLWSWYGIFTNKVLVSSDNIVFLKDETFFDITSSTICSNTGDVLKGLSISYKLFDTERVGNCIFQVQEKLVCC